jgi:hypothetical protein
MKPNREERVSTEALAESLVISIHEVTKRLVQDKKQLERFHVLTDDPDVFLELFMFHFFATLRAVAYCSLPLPARDSVVKHMKHRIASWLVLQVGVGDQGLPQIEALFDLRLAQYEAAVGKMLQGKDCAATEILIKNLGGVLSEEVSNADISTWFALYSLFRNRVSVT